MADDSFVALEVVGKSWIGLRALCLMSALISFPFVASANQAGKSQCEAGIRQSGFEPESPYEFRDSGFFTKEKHVFGVFSCELNSDGTVSRILRGESTVAEDGYFGLAILDLRKRILQASSQRNDEAVVKRERAIEDARNEYQSVSNEIEKAKQAALLGIRSGKLDRAELERLGLTVDDLKAFESALDVDPDLPASVEKLDGRSIPEEEPDNSELERQKKEAEQERLEQQRSRLVEELPKVRSLVSNRNFFQAEIPIRQAIALGAWGTEELGELEKLIFESVRSVPASQTAINEAGYRLLVIIAPDNEKYQNSYKKYQAQRAREAEAQRRKLDEQASEARRKAEAQRLRDAKARFEGVASRLNSQSSEAQRQFVFEQAEGKLVVASGRVETVERAGLLTPATVTLSAGYGGLTVFCRLPSSTSNAALARISKGSRYECVGELMSYTFIFGSAALSVRVSD